MIVIAPIVLIAIIWYWNHSINQAVNQKLELLRKDIMDEVRSMMVDHEDDRTAHNKF